MHEFVEICFPFNDRSPDEALRQVLHTRRKDDYFTVISAEAAKIQLEYVQYFSIWKRNLPSSEGHSCFNHGELALLNQQGHTYAYVYSF